MTDLKMFNQEELAQLINVSRDQVINATINMYKNDHIKMYKINST